MHARGPEGSADHDDLDEAIERAALARLGAGASWPDALAQAVRATLAARPRRSRRARLPGRRSLTAALSPAGHGARAATSDAATAGGDRIEGRDPLAEPAVAPAPVMRKAEGADPIVDDPLREVPGVGEPLPSPLLRELEAALGFDLDAVRIHRGAEVDRAARALDATAFAIDQRIGVRSDVYDPARPDGVRLLAHEVAHTVQARGGGGAGGGAAGVSQPGDAAEVEADRFADAFVARAAAADGGDGAAAGRDEPGPRDDGGDGHRPAPARPPRLELGTRPSAAVQRQTTGVPATPTEPVTLTELATSGTSWTGQPLGFQIAVAYYMNGVELRFALHGAEAQFTRIRPRQYGGPEAKWVLHGDPNDVSAFRSLHEGAGPGWDDPLAESVARRPDAVAYRDTPGPEVGLLTLDPSGPPARVYCVQNFTGWIEGVPTSGGSALRISPAVSWYSIVSLVNVNREAPERPPRYVPIFQNEAGLGWRPTTAPTR